MAKNIGDIWSADVAYAIGLLTSDGNLSKDGRHIEFCSKDQELVEVFCRSLRLSNRIGTKKRGTVPRKLYYRVQFGDVAFYSFLMSIGLKKNKSLILGPVMVPEGYFPDFLRGLVDGDGNINVFKHPESKNPQLKVRVYSGSRVFLSALKETIKKIYGLSGGCLIKIGRVSCLNYSKKDSIVLLKKIYYNSKVPCLARKHKIAEPFMQAGVAELAQAIALGAIGATLEGSNPPARTSNV